MHIFVNFAAKASSFICILGLFSGGCIQEGCLL